MGYKLKPGQEEFTIVDGPLAGMNYKKGVEYPKRPDGYEDRFDAVGMAATVSIPTQPKEKQKTVTPPSKVSPKDTPVKDPKVPPKEKPASKAETKGNDS